MTTPRHSELGGFLRSRREKLTPQNMGLEGGQRRRTPGLRREEVAELAGISTDWYTRLEQGRTVQPSSSTLDALSRALRLSNAEQRHLRALALGPRQRAFWRESVSDSLRRMVERLNQPAYLTGQRWDVLAWNAAASHILTDFGRQAEADRNILLYMLTDPAARQLFGDGWTHEARRMVAQFRVTYDLWSAAPAFVDLAQRLQRASPEFAAWWDAHEIRDVATGQKVLHHPEQGAQRFDYASFQANENPALKLVIYTPV